MVDVEGAVGFVEGLDTLGELTDVEAVGIHLGKLELGWIGRGCVGLGGYVVPSGKNRSN